jgi:hypothetical protein
MFRVRMIYGDGGRVKGDGGAASSRSGVTPRRGRLVERPGTCSGATVVDYGALVQALA